MNIAGIVNQQTKKKPVEEALVEALMNAIKVQNPPSNRTKANVKPSKMGCDRQMYYILTGATPNEVSTVDPKLVMIQKIGTFIHSMLQEALSKAAPQGIVFRDPTEVAKLAAEKGINTRIVPANHSTDNPYEVHCYNEDYDLSFMWDGAVFFRELNTIIEIKSEDHFKWMRRLRPEDDHIEQGTSYSLGLGINTVIFLYVDRNYLGIKAYKVDISEEMRQGVRDHITEVKKQVSEKTLPAKVTCKSCRYCDYTKACKADLNPLTE